MVVDVYARMVDAPFCSRCQGVRGGWAGGLTLCTCADRPGTVIAKVRSVVIKPPARLQNTPGAMTPKVWAEVLWQPVA